MPEVTIAADDLQALLFASGAAQAASKDIRSTLRRDPQFEQVESQLADAIKRTGDAWRKAGRPKEFPERFQVSAEDMQLLRNYRAMGAASAKGIQERYHGEAPRSLITKGLLELGVWREIIIWANAGEERFENVERRFRLTPDAIEMLMRADLAASAPAPKGNKIYGTHIFQGGVKHCLRCGAFRMAVEDNLVSSDCSGVPHHSIADQSDQG